MIFGCLICVAMSVLLFAGQLPGRRSLSRLADVETGAAVEVGPHPARARVWWCLGWFCGLAGLWLVNNWAGPSAAVVGAAGLVIIACCLRLLLAHRAARAASQARVGVAYACGVVAAQIRVGRVPAEALHSAAQDCPVLAVASRAQDLGGDVTAVWQRQSALPGHGGLLELSRAWRVSRDTGAPLARSLDQVTEALTADVASQAVITGELAAARATGKIMAVLPLCGLGMGYLLGGDPLEFLLSNPWGWGCLLAGVACAAAGVLWIDRLARPAEQG